MKSFRPIDTTVTVRRDGSVTLLLPALIRSFRLKDSDSITIHRLKGGDLFLHFYRKDGQQWRQLMRGGKSRRVRHPDATNP